MGGGGEGTGGGGAEEEGGGGGGRRKEEEVTGMKIGKEEGERREELAGRGSGRIQKSSDTGILQGFPLYHLHMMRPIIFYSDEDNCMRYVSTTYLVEGSLICMISQVPM